MAKRRELTEAGVMTMLAAIFDRRGWPLEIDLMPQMLSGTSPGTVLDADRLTRRIPADYLQRNCIERSSLRAALAEMHGIVVSGG